jgi:hypothetical protein
MLVYDEVTQCEPEVLADFGIISTPRDRGQAPFKWGRGMSRKAKKACTKLSSTRKCNAARRTRERRKTAWGRLENDGAASNDNTYNGWRMSGKPRPINFPRRTGFPTRNSATQRPVPKASHRKTLRKASGLCRQSLSRRSLRRSSGALPSRWPRGRSIMKRRCRTHRKRNRQRLAAHAKRLRR